MPSPNTDAPRSALDAASFRVLVDTLLDWHTAMHQAAFDGNAVRTNACYAHMRDAYQRLLAAAAERDALRERVAELEERHAIFYALEQDVTAALHRCGSELVRAQRRRREGAGDGAS